MEGRIIKLLGGFYTVEAEGNIFDCHARGLFRKEGVKPVVGDLVTAFPGEGEGDVGQIVDVHSRKNVLTRPRVANVDRIFLVFSACRPKPGFEVLNRYLAVLSDEEIPVSLVVTKADLADEADFETIRRAFHGAPYSVFRTSAVTGEGLDELRAALKGKVSVFAGPSGVGKSSLLNRLLGEEKTAVGALSRKIERGKNTTRHTELYFVDEETFLLDTPGFTAVDFDGILPENLIFGFPEMVPFSEKCRYTSCKHNKEEGCAVRDAVEKGLISPVRYASYLEMSEHLASKKR